MSKKNKQITLKTNIGKTSNIPIKNENNFLIESDTIFIKKTYMYSLIFMFITMSLMSFQYGISGDEFGTNVCGKLSLNYYKTFGNDKSIFQIPKSIDKDQNWQLYGAFFVMVCAVLNKMSPLNEFTNEHIINSWAGFLMIVFASLITAKILNKQAAIFAAWLLFLSPFVLGHSMNNPKDIPFAATFIAGIYAIIYFVDTIENLKKIDYVLIIFVFGSCIGTRIGGLLLIPFFIAYICINYLHSNIFLKQKYNLKRFIKPFLIVSVLGYLSCSLFWPFAAENPITNPIKTLKLMTNFDIRILQVFNGQKIHPESDYLLKNLLYTNSIPVLLGVLFSIPFIWQFRKNSKASILYFIIFATIFPLVYIIYKKSVVYHAWRHVLFIAPGIIIIATFGWYSFNDYLSKKVNLTIKSLGWILCSMLLFEPLIFIIQSFPNTVTYYNIFVGGTSKAHGYYEMDSYGNSIKQEADWFIKNELPKIKPNEHKILVTNFTTLVREYFRPYPNIELQYIRFWEKNNSKWDYALFHIAINMPTEQIKNGSWIPQNPLHVTSVFGKPLCVSYKRASLHDMIGLEYMKKNNPDSALYHFNKYLALEPKDINILNNAAHIYSIMHNLPKANELVEQALLVDNTNDFANYIKGNVLQMQNNIVGANFYFGKYHFYTRNYQEAYNAFNKCLGTEFNNKAKQYIAEMNEIIRKARIEQREFEEKEAQKKK